MARPPAEVALLLPFDFCLLTFAFPTGRAHLKLCLEARMPLVGRSDPKRGRLAEGKRVRETVIGGGLMPSLETPHARIALHRTFRRAPRPPRGSDQTSSAPGYPCDRRVRRDRRSGRVGGYRRVRPPQRSVLPGAVGARVAPRHSLA